jgi:hypothetical protein
MQTVIFNTANAGTNNDTVHVTGTSADDKLTVAEMPTVAGDNATLLPNGTVAGASAAVFLDGTPYLNAPPATIANSRPGVAGGGSGPDLLINGISGALTLDGGGNSGTSGKGDQAIVYAASEGNLVDPAALAAGADIFGLGTGVLQPGFGVGKAYDFVDASDGEVFVFNNSAGSLVPVALNTASFVQAGPAFAAQQPGLIVNGGDEAAPQADGIADEFSVFASTNFNIQVNGNLPGLTTVNGVPQGDQLDASFPGSIDVFSDNASPPNVTLTGQTSNSDSPFGIKYSSIERVDLTPGNGIVNLIGDNNVVGGNQNDYFKVRGGIDPFTSPAPTSGMNQFSLRIGGSWDPTTGNVGTPPPAGGLSSAIWFNGVTRINASGGAAAGFDTHGNAIPDDTHPDGTNALDITPYANNTPQGWGIETYWDQGNANADGGVPNPDLLIFNGVSGVSENIVIQPSGTRSGQVIDNNEATGTPIAVVNYVLNTNIIVNGSSPAGTAGDTDSLTLMGTNPGSAGTSGNDHFVADFTAAGTPGNELVKVTDLANGNPLYNLQNFTNFNTLNVAMGGGSDIFELKSGRTDGSLGLNVGGGPGVHETIQVDGSATSGDAFTVSAGATSDAGTLTALLSGATAPSVLNFTGTKNVNFVGGGGAGSDSLTLDGTGGNDVFTATPGGVGATKGTAQVNSGPAVSLTGLGSGAGTALTLNGGGGSDTFSLTQAAAANGPIPSVNVNGGATSSVSVTGDGAADTFNDTPLSANSATLVVNGAAGTTYNHAGTSSLSIDGVAGAGSTLTMAPDSAVPLLGPRQQRRCAPVGNRYLHSGSRRGPWNRHHHDRRGNAESLVRELGTRR